MISMSSWCAAMQRSVTRASAMGAVSLELGTKTSACGWKKRMGGGGWKSGFRQLRQTRGGDGLSMAFALLVGHVQFDLCSKFREFHPQDFSGAIENMLATVPGHDATKRHQMAEGIEIGVMGDRIAEV